MRRNQECPKITEKVNLKEGITWYKLFFSKASSEEENSPSPPPVPDSKVELEPNLISEEVRMIQDDLDDLSQEERRNALYGDPRTSEMAGVGIVKDEIDDLSDEDSDLVIDEPEEDTIREEVESEQEFDSDRPMESEEREMKPSLPSVMFLADQRALLQPKTELQRNPEQAIQPKSRVGGGRGGGVAAQSRAPASSNTQASASSSPAAPAAPFTPYFNLDILATVASMNR